VIAVADGRGPRVVWIVENEVVLWEQKNDENDEGVDT